MFHFSTINTPLGAMVAVADTHSLYLLAFEDQKELSSKIAKIEKRGAIQEGDSPLINRLKEELKSYFSGRKKTFQIPLNPIGTLFQKGVWAALENIPFGQTTAYSELAKNLNSPTASRAVAKANSTNPITLIIPCHRVINKDGSLGGYAGNIERKKWLLHHETLFW